MCSLRGANPLTNYPFFILSLFSILSEQYNEEETF